ncbi:hypothetical protein ACGFW5_07580 [Streptomyces sp. NPDC048416]|uniref:hypothetical protein n=1 Tax=Streptomyces sp. NPDC048416 TaxID=3365546 RepID=UPI003723F83B
MHAGHEDTIAACADAEALLREGRTSAARKAARAALYTEGPDPRLYALLGRAYAAEGADDQADRAEAVFREGLDAFPDDLGLLAAYTDLCLTDDDPARNRRAHELAARLRQLAPDSAQAVPAADVPGPVKQPSGGRVQRHDARLVLAVIGHPAGAAQQAWDQARSRPADDRTAVLAETLTALARRGRAPLRLLVRAPLAGSLGCWAWFVVLLLAVVALGLPAWAGLAALLGPMLFPLLHGVLRGARRRAGARPHVSAEPPPSSYATFPALPPVPPYTTREKAAAALVVLTAPAALAVFAGYLARR